jgi:hypothetical protein
VSSDQVQRAGRYSHPERPFRCHRAVTRDTAGAVTPVARFDMISRRLSCFISARISLIDMNGSRRTRFRARIYCWICRWNVIRPVAGDVNPLSPTGETLHGDAARERRIAAGRNELRRAAMRGDAECIPNAAGETMK